MISFSVQNLANQQLLSYYMHHVIKKANVISKSDNSVFIIGQRGAGRSSYYNAIVDSSKLISIEGKMKLKYELNIAQNSSNSLAKISQNFLPMTVIPNIAEIKMKNQKTLLIDMIGFKEDMNQIEVFLKNMIFQTCLTSAKRAKFIIVVNSADFLKGDGVQLYKVLNNFISLFELGKLKQNQRKQLFESVNLIISSVPMTSSYEQTKEKYIADLKAAIQKYKQIKQKKCKDQQMFQFIKELLTTILNNKRVQLFQLPKNKGIPNTFAHLKQFYNQEGHFVQLSNNISKYLKINYNHDMSQLSEQQQINLRNLFKNYLNNYESLLAFLKEIFKIFLNNPVNSQIDYQQIFKTLAKFLQKQRFHQNIPEFDDQIQIYKANLSPLDVIKQLISLSQKLKQMQKQKNRSQAEKNQVSFWIYFRKFLNQALQTFAKCFSSTNKQKYILLTLRDIFSQQITHLQKITVFQRSFKLQCELRLRDMLIDLLQINKQQIIYKFLLQLDKQDDYYYSLKQARDIIDYLDKYSEQRGSSKLLYSLYYKTYKNLQELTYNQKIDKIKRNYLLHSLINAIKLLHYLKLEIKANPDTQDQNNYYIQKLLQNINIILQKLLKYSQHLTLEVIAIYEQFALLSCLKSFYKTKQQVQWMQKLADSHRSTGQINEAKIMYEKLIRKKEITKNNDKLTRIQAKKGQAQIVLKQNGNLKNQLKQNTKQAELKNKTAPTLLQFIFKLNKIYLTEDKIFNQKDILANVEQVFLTNKISIENQNQINQQLPDNLHNHQIIVYSKRILKFIENKKVILLLGEKGSGKTTAWYWLSGKMLTSITTKDKPQFSLALSSNIPDRINKQTLTPYIYSINQNEVLIDTASFDQSDLQRLVIIRHFLRQIIKTSSECKMLLVTKEQDVLEKNCVSLIKLINFCGDILDQTDYLKSVAFLFTKVNQNKKQDIVQKLRKVRLSFQTEEQHISVQDNHKLYIVERKKCQKIIEAVTKLQKYEFFYNHLQKSDRIIEDLTQTRGWDFSISKPEQIDKKIFIKTLLKMKKQRNIDFYKKVNQTSNHLINIGHSAIFATLQKKILTSLKNKTNIKDIQVSPYEPQDKDFSVYIKEMYNKIRTSKHPEKYLQFNSINFHHQSQQQKSFQLSILHISIQVFQILEWIYKESQYTNEFQTIAKNINQVFNMHSYQMSFTSPQTRQKYIILQMYYKAKLETLSILRSQFQVARKSQVHSIENSQFWEGYTETDFGKIPILDFFFYINESDISNFFKLFLDFIDFEEFKQETKQNKLVGMNVMKRALSIFYKFINCISDTDRLKLKELCGSLSKEFEEDNKPIEAVKMLLLQLNTMDRICQIQESKSEKQLTDIDKISKVSQIIQFKQIFQKLALSLCTVNLKLALQICNQFKFYHVQLDIFKKIRLIKQLRAQQSKLLKIIYNSIDDNCSNPQIIQTAKFYLNIEQNKEKKAKIQSIKTKLENTNKNKRIIIIQNKEINKSVIHHYNNVISQLQVKEYSIKDIYKTYE